MNSRFVPLTQHVSLRIANLSDQNASTTFSDNTYQTSNTVNRSVPAPKDKMPMFEIA